MTDPQKLADEKAKVAALREAFQTLAAELESRRPLSSEGHAQGFVDGLHEAASRIRDILDRPSTSGQSDVGRRAGEV